MQRFFFKLMLVCLPVLTLIVFIEIFFRIQDNSLKIKSEYLGTNIKKIDVLILGSSHNQTALNPKYFNNIIANLAYGSQDYYLDSAILFNYIHKLTNLKVVVLEVDYHSLEYKNDDDYWRKVLYNYYYNLNLPCKIGVKRYSFFLNNPIYYLKQIELNLKGEKGKTNKYGFSTETGTTLFESFNYDSLRILKTSYRRLNNRHKNVSQIVFSDNARKLMAMIDICNRNDIKVLLLSTPMFQSYRLNMIKNKNERRIQFITSIINQSENINFYNYSDSSKYNRAIYFKNDDHLNQMGSQLFSKSVNKLINDLTQK